MDHQKDAAFSGFLNLLKPPGMSSHDVVSLVRRVLHQKRVGHAGTLDPGAAGVLPVAVGSAARLLEYIEHTRKSYRVEITLGMATDAEDATGRVTERLNSFRMPSPEEIKTALKCFEGEIEQIPPLRSAIKIHGKRAYTYARDGKSAQLPKRCVQIHRIELLSVNVPSRRFLIDVSCSRGTYIRSLTTSIGRQLGIPAVMSFLLRTQVGAFSLMDAVTLEEFAADGAGSLLPPQAYLQHLPHFDLPHERRSAFLNGLPTRMPEGSNQPGILCVYDMGEFLGIGRWEESEKSVFPVKVLTKE